jgi:hypothetical protein
MTETLEDLRRDLHSQTLKLKEGLMTERGYAFIRGRLINKINKLKSETKDPQNKAA